MGPISIHSTSHIRPGKLGDFKAVARDCLAIVREKDPGTLVYDWYLSPDEATCVVRETYASSEAMLAHLDNCQPVLARMLEAASVEIEIFGEPSDELIAALSVVPHVRYTTLVTL